MLSSTGVIILSPSLATAEATFTNWLAKVKLPLLIKGKPKSQSSSSYLSLVVLFIVLERQATLFQLYQRRFNVTKHASFLHAKLHSHDHVSPLSHKNEDDYSDDENLSPCI